MKWQVFCIGKPSLDYAKRGIDEYSKRLRRYSGLDIRESREAGSEKNSRYLLDSSQGAIRIAMDERGKHLSTREFAGLVERWQIEGTRKVAFLVGGAEGHTEELRKEADQVWALSKLTLQHELALVVLLEQIYRVHTLLKGEPYHRD